MLAHVSSVRRELLWLEIRHLRKVTIKCYGRTLGASEIPSCLHRWKEKNYEEMRTADDDESMFLQVEVKEQEGGKGKESVSGEVEMLKIREETREEAREKE